MKETVLVTGVAGFIGSHTAKECMRLGMTVVGIDDLSGGYRSNVPNGVEFHEVSVCNVERIESLFKENNFAHVYHLAAYAAEGLSHFIRRYNYETNLVGSVNLINASVVHGVKTFIFASSIAVYGPGQTPMTEDMVPEPEDPYGVSKYAIELDLKAAHRMFGLDYVVFRPHNVYGEHQNIADKYRNVIGIFMNQVMQGQPMTVFGDGLQTRAFSHVDDVAPYIAVSPHVASARNQVINIGADTPYTVLDLARQVADAFGVPATVKHLDARKEVYHAFSSHDKMRAVFGSQTSIPLSEGIRRMATWVRAHGPMRPVEFRNIEITKNLPPSWRTV